MRAVLFPFLANASTEKIMITDEAFQHLNVVRVKVNEEILVLNGLGLKAHTRVSSIFKNSIELIVDSIQESKCLHDISLAIANPKKEAFEDILKIAVELGVKNVFPLSSDYSQYDYLPNSRCLRILESALVQSNNAFMPVVHSQNTLNEFLNNLTIPLYFFNSRPNNDKKIINIKGPKIILIGPEGGFSTNEESIILAKTGVFSIHLPTPILRAPTAVASSIGYLLSLS